MKLIFNVLGGNKRRRGFTMLEMLTVIAVISILIALLASFTSKLRARTKVTQVTVLLEKLQSALEEYNLKFRCYPPAPPGPGCQGFQNYPAGYTGSQLLNYYLTTAFRITPNLANGEVKATVNEGPFLTLDSARELSALGSALTAPASASMPTLPSIIDPWYNPLNYQLNMVQAMDPMNALLNTNNYVNVYTPVLYSWGPNGIDDTAAGVTPNDDIFAGRKKTNSF